MHWAILFNGLKVSDIKELILYNNTDNKFLFELGLISTYSQNCGTIDDNRFRKPDTRWLAF